MFQKSVFTTMIDYIQLKLVSLEESNSNPYWDTSKRYAKDVLEVIQKLGVPFCLDKLTVADGNCFSFGIIQQLSQPEIFDSLEAELKEIVKRRDVLSFKKKVFDFASNSPQVLERRDFIAIGMGVDWDTYWKKMLMNGEFADTTFIHCTAWFLNMDLVIVSDVCNSQNKFFKIPGYFDEDLLERRKLYLGYITDIHYQSILPKRVPDGKTQSKLPTKCPACNMEVNQLMKHLKKKKCRESLGEARISELREIAAKEAKSNYQSKYIATGSHKLAQKKFVESGGNAKAQAKYTARKRVSDYDEMKKSQNARKFWHVRLYVF